MTDHLTDEQLRAFASHAINGAALLLADDHLTSCAACEQRLLSMSSGAAAAMPGHIDDQLVEKLASGTLSESEETAVELHAAVCAVCRERWSFLRGDDEARGAIVPFRWRVLAAAIAAAIVVLFGIVLMSRVQRPAAVVTVTPVPAPQPTPQPVPRAEPAATIVLHDAHGDITASGTTLNGIPEGTWRGEVEAAVRRQSLSFLSTADLIMPPLVLRGAGETAAPAVVAKDPVATVVEPDRPRFRWTAPASSVVRVSIFTTDTQRVAQSGWLTASEWQVPTPLRRGATFVWQVESRRSGDAPDGAVSAPVRFRVLSSAGAKRLAAARASGSHLVLGTVAAEHGLVDLAAAELRTLRALNPGSPVAAALYERALRAQRLSVMLHEHAQPVGVRSAVSSLPR